jgi:hypothetical protein
MRTCSAQYNYDLIKILILLCTHLKSQKMIQTSSVDRVTSYGKGLNADRLRNAPLHRHYVHAGSEAYPASNTMDIRVSVLGDKPTRA